MLQEIGTFLWHTFYKITCIHLQVVDYGGDQYIKLNYRALNA